MSGVNLSDQMPRKGILNLSPAGTSGSQCLLGLRLLHNFDVIFSFAVEGRSLLEFIIKDVDFTNVGYIYICFYYLMSSRRLL